MINIKKWFNYNPFESKIKISAGIIIVLNNKKILLCHPTGHKWVNSFSFPKGHVDKGETEIDAAIRELREETSITIEKSSIVNPNKPYIVHYVNKKGFTYKKVFLYLVHIADISQVGLTSEVIPTTNLQQEEVDWCGFLTKQEASSKIFHRMFHLLDLI